MTVRVLLHAPTAAALARARSNARNLLAADPSAEIRIIANADAVPAAIETPDATTDAYLFLCANTLESRALTAPPGIATVPAAVLDIARMQEAGWAYIRA